MDARPGRMSGGEQQRVAVARALINDPPLVLADEPTGNLDTESSEKIFELMRRYNRERSTTVVIVTHDPRIAVRCSRIVEVVLGSTRSVVGREALRRGVAPHDGPERSGLQARAEFRRYSESLLHSRADSRDVDTGSTLGARAGSTARKPAAAPWNPR
jgi:ABC-type multidrug transport system ATPase subunit